MNENDNDFYSLDLNTRKLCNYSIYKDEKAQKALCELFDLLDKEEKEAFLKKSDENYELKYLGSKTSSISKSAIYIALRVKKELGIGCYPIINTVARKGWSVADGTFAWSMPLLKSSAISSELYSFEPARMYLLKNTELNISQYNGFENVISLEKVS